MEYEYYRARGWQPPDWPTRFIGYMMTVVKIWNIGGL